MPFRNEKLKEAIKRKANFRCCICELFDVEIHHIIPESEEGPETEENAAPLCGSCHNIFGGNPEKRRVIRQRRDQWYEICAARNTRDPANTKQLHHLMENTVTKVDLNQMADKLEGLIKGIRAAPADDPMRLRDLAVASNTAFASLSSVPYFAAFGLPANALAICGGCGRATEISILRDQGGCPYCKTRQ